MLDKKVYAWAIKDVNDKTFAIDTNYPNCELDIIQPLYSIEEVQYVIENNELPKLPVAWVFWDNEGFYKKAVGYKYAVKYPWDNIIPVYSADELLAELQKEI